MYWLYYRLQTTFFRKPWALLWRLPQNLLFDPLFMYQSISEVKSTVFAGIIKQTASKELLSISSNPFLMQWCPGNWDFYGIEYQCSESVMCFCPHIRCVLQSYCTSNALSNQPNQLDNVDRCGTQLYKRMSENWDVLGTRRPAWINGYGARLPSGRSRVWISPWEKFQKKFWKKIASHPLLAWW